MLRTPAEPFRVAFVTGVTPTKWARIWRERHPEILLELVPIESDDQRTCLDDGRADACLLRLPVDQETLSVIPLYEEVQYVVAPADHAFEAADSVTLADLEAENIVSGSGRAAVDLVATGIGIALMPQSISRMLSRRDVISRPVSDGPVTRIALAWRSADENAAIEDFVGIVRGRTSASSRGARDGEPGDAQRAEVAAKAARVAKAAAKNAAKNAKKSASAVAAKKSGSGRAKSSGSARKRRS